MEKMYKVYKRTIGEKEFYFIKQYLAFPEYNNVAPVLQQYAMHTNFNKACSIARVYDAAIQKKLSTELGIKEATAQQSRLEIYSYKWKQVPVMPFLLRLIRMYS